MFHIELLEMIKKLEPSIGDNEDQLLQLLCEIAEEEILDYCGDVVVPESLVAQMVVIKYQRRGSESLSNTNYSGNGEVYLTDYPPYILRRLDRLKSNKRNKLRTL